jgi:hypothetical protein
MRVGEFNVSRRSCTNVVITDATQSMQYKHVVITEDKCCEYNVVITEAAQSMQYKHVVITEDKCCEYNQTVLSNML